MNIFITEDEQIIAEDLKLTLKRMGYDVIGIASKGKEAISMIEQTNPDLILMDIMLDGEMTGIDVARYLMDRLDIPIVYLTAYSDENTLKEASETSPYGFLCKPFEEKQLYATLEMAYHKFKKKLS